MSNNSENIKLQAKLDVMLAQVIKDFEALGFQHYPIRGKVRITNNKSRLGSAQTVNGATLVIPRQGRKKGTPYWRDGITPEFRISISRLECKDDASIRDVLFHEVIHTSEGCFNHGKKFKQLAAAVNSAYGTNITTSKKSPSPAAAALPKEELLSLLAKHVGESFCSKKKEFKLVGFNSKPKYCCDLVDARGVGYTAPALLVASSMGLLDSE